MKAALIEEHSTEIRQFCKRRRIKELAVFGSILRDDFGPNSDVDFLATFERDFRRTLLDEAQMELEVVWAAARESVPDLLSRLERLLSSEEP